MSLFTFGLHHSGDEGMIIHRIRESLQSSMDRGFSSPMWAKPLLLCSPCMNSTWGSVVYWSFGWFVIAPGWKFLLLFWPMAVVIAVALSILVESLYSSLKKEPDGDPGRDQIIHNRSSSGAGSQ
jgi:hypothetical protein